MPQTPRHVNLDNTFNIDCRPPPTHPHAGRQVLHLWLWREEEHIFCCQGSLLDPAVVLSGAFCMPAWTGRIAAGVRVTMAFLYGVFLGVCWECASMGILLLATGTEYYCGTLVMSLIFTGIAGFTFAVAARAISRGHCSVFSCFVFQPKLR